MRTGRDDDGTYRAQNCVAAAFFPLMMIDPRTMVPGKRTRSTRIVRPVVPQGGFCGLYLPTPPYSSYHTFEPPRESWSQML